MQITNKSFLCGKLVRCYDKATKEEYDDWRAYYVDKPGLIHRFEVSGVLGLDFEMVAIYLNEPDNPDQKYLKTSEVLEIEIKENIFKVETLNSYYEFELGDFGITEEEKELLMLNRVFK